jgi:hypothetical protein
MEFPVRLIFVASLFLFTSCSQSSDTSKVHYIDDNSTDALDKGVAFTASAFINPSRKFVEIHSENDSNQDIRCDYMRVLLKYKSIDGQVGFRSASVQDVIIPKKSSVQVNPESDKEIIETLELIDPTSMISTVLPKVEMRCHDEKDKLIAGKTETLNMEFGAYINTSRKFLEFSVRNNESKPVVCKSIAVKASYVDLSTEESLGYRTVSLRDIEVAPGKLFYSSESASNKAMIETLEAVYNQKAVLAELDTDLKFNCQIKAE